MRRATHLGLILLLFLRAATADQQPQHLLPMRHYTGESAEYRRLIYKHLLVTPGQLGRMIYEPGWDSPEWAVSVYGSGKASTGFNAYRSYHITVTRVLESRWVTSIWTSLPSNNEERLHKAIHTSRADVQIGPELALAVRSAWATMLSRTRPEEDRYLYMDAPTVEFMLGAQRGQITPPRPGLTSEMYEIGEALAKLCALQSAQREAEERELIRRLERFEAKARKA